MGTAPSVGLRPSGGELRFERGPRATTCFVVIVACLSSACVPMGSTTSPADPDSWPSADPRTARCRAEPAAAFETTLTSFRMSGYQITELDEARLYIQVQSKVDGDVYQEQTTAPWMWNEVRRITMLNFQFQPNGYVLVTAAGYHVQNGRLDPRVVTEIADIIRLYFTNPGATPPAP